MLADPIRVFSSFSCDAPQEMNGKEGEGGGCCGRCSNT